MICALLLGRKGSVGFPEKNLYPIFGHPLAWYPMIAALKAKSVDRVYLSTDDERLMALAEENGVEVIERPAYLCTKEALGEDAYGHGFREIQTRIGEQPELMVLLFCNAATLTPDQIDEGTDFLLKNPDFDSAVTVSRFNMFSPVRARRIGDDGAMQPFLQLDSMPVDEVTCDRDCQGDVWFADCALSVVRPHNLQYLDTGMPPQKWMGKRIHPICQDAGCDVDYEWQIPMVKWWLERNATHLDLKEDNDGS